MRRAVLLVGLWLTLASPCMATTLLWMGVQELTKNSTAVVMGRVISQTRLAERPGVALDRVTLKISRTLKGDLQGTIVVNNPGFPGASVFQEGDEVVLFLYTRNDTHVITGFQQGSFKIVSDASGNRVLDRGIPSRQRAVAGQRSVDTLVSEVLNAAR